MANVYFDLDLATGLNDGTSWTDAYRSMASFTNANLAAGDDVWIKGTQTGLSSPVIESDTAGQQNPVRVHVVKTATTATPPAQSDLIPGWRTGDARTEANRAYNDADGPSASSASTDTTMDVVEYAYWYGFTFIAGRWLRFANGQDVGLLLEECSLTWGAGSGGRALILGPSAGPVPTRVTLLNCELIPTNANDQIAFEESCNAELIGCILNAGAANTAGLIDLGSQSTGVVRFIGCDFSDLAHTLFDLGNSAAGTAILQNCQLHASSALTTGTAAGRYRIELHGCSSVTGKSSGTVQNNDILTDAGDIVEETTAVRTGGANDGSSGWSLAFTPKANGTRDQYYALVGPWMAFKVSGDGTSKTVTVYIANSGAADYNDDDVWLEVIYPSEGGTAQYDHQTTQMDLLGTPTAVADDTTSTWGTGGNNPQKLQATIAPDYVGRAYCRVHFAKNFAASPETLYVDPLPEVA